MNFAIYGVSGAGKDTVSNHLSDYYGHRKLRLAHTIKAAICEEYGISFKELEEQKRTNKELRDAHHEYSDVFGGERTTINRIKLIHRKESMDFQLLDSKDEQIVIIDCRTTGEMKAILDNGDYYAILLTKRNKTEYAAGHYTDKQLFDDVEKVQEFIDKYDGKVFVIDNNDEPLNYRLYAPIYRTDGSIAELLSAVDSIVSRTI